VPSRLFSPFKTTRLYYVKYHITTTTPHITYSITDRTLIFPSINFIHSFIHQWLYSPLLGPGLSFSFVIFFYTDGGTPWTSDQPVARPLPTHRATQTQNKRTHKHPCLMWDSNPWSQRSSGRRQLMPQTTRPPWSASINFTLSNIP
jgi:hypothetical protein